MNNFKEGDTVNVYGLEYPGHELSEPTRALVLANYTDNKDILDLKLYEGVDFIGFAQAHYKQCRLIKASD